MKTKEIKDMQKTCKELLVSKLLDYVRQHGRRLTDWELEMLGPFDGDCRITKALDLRDDNGGRLFTLGRLGEGAETFSIQFLVVDEYRGEDYVSAYYCHNDGPQWDGNTIESDYMSLLNASPAFVSAVADIIVKNLSDGSL